MDLYDFFKKNSRANRLYRLSGIAPARRVPGEAILIGLLLAFGMVWLMLRAQQRKQLAPAT